VSGRESTPAWNDKITFPGPGAEKRSPEFTRRIEAKHLRVRTFLVVARCDEDVETGVIAYAHHIDHVVTDAERRAVAEAVGDFLAGRSTVPFAKRVHMAQRKMMRVAIADK
jgi:hypothetical protein